jgi:response regulator RpfG family c-di-GMP phosphodiesterase
MNDACSNSTQSIRRHRRNRRSTILFVDDDPDAVGAFLAIVQRYDLRVLTHYSGEQGYLAALKFKPDVIVTDLRMPQGSGEMLLECLHRNARTSAIPVIVLSGKNGPDVPGFVQHLRAAKFLPKPISAALLVDEIRRYVPLRPARARSLGNARSSKTA